MTIVNSAWRDLEIAQTIDDEDTVQKMIIIEYVKMLRRL